MDTEIIPISPKQPDIPFEDTVAENFLPYATAPIAPDNKFSYGELWKAWVKTTAAYPEM